MTFDYIDTAKGGANRRNNVMRIADFHPDGGTDVYRTYLRFTEELKTYTTTNLNGRGKPSVAKYPGPGLADFVPLDFDSEENLALALEDVRRFVEHLDTLEVDRRSVRFYFSGMKGFAGEMPANLFGGFQPSTDITKRMRVLIERLTANLGLSTLDTAIYEPMRLWRVPNTRHGKSGLYKIPLTADEAMTLDIEEIRALAKMPRMIETMPEGEFGANFDLRQLWAATKGAEPAPTTGTTDPDAPITSGSRHPHLLSVAGAMRRQGCDEGEILDALRSVNARRCDPPKEDADLVTLAHDVVGRYQEEPQAYVIHDVKRTSSVGGEDDRLSGPVLVNMADVQREEVSWLWRWRIPFGKLTLLEGDPGLGKSWLTMALATSVTLGSHPGLRLPDDYSNSDPRSVLVMTAEDGLGDTVRPRLEDMGADLTRVQVLTAVINEQGRETFPSLARDLWQLESALSGGDYALIIIDPINAYLGGVDGHQDVDIRSVLGPLAKLAEKYGVAILCLRHITKGGRDKSIYRGLGSIGYTAAARSVLLVGVDPDDENLRVVVCHKHNLAPDSPGIAFEIQNGQFFWRGESSVTADAMLAPTSTEDRSVREEAADFLRELLADGPRRTEDVQREAKRIGISASTLKRARHDLNIRSERVGGLGAAGWWEMRLPYGLTKRTNVPNDGHESALAAVEATEPNSSAPPDPLSSSSLAAARFGESAMGSPALEAYASTPPRSAESRH